MHLKAIRKIRAILALSRRMRALETSFSDLQTQIDQYIWLASVRAPIPRMPPKHLQVRVAGIYNSSFYSSGQQQVSDIEAFLQSNGKSFNDFATILDFGCGCGRTLIPLSQLVPTERVYGSDIDGEAIHWLKTHHPSFGDLDVNGIRPPTKYADDTFDFIYVISVFTHLPEDMQLAWLEELHRIMKPGGVGVFTTHGEMHYSKLQGEAAREISARGFHYSMTGLVDGLPEFYQTTYHSHEYVRREWGKYFDIVAIQELGLGHNHDLVMVAKDHPRSRD